MKDIASNHIDINGTVLSPQANTEHPPEGASTPSGNSSSSPSSPLPENPASENGAATRKKPNAPGNMFRPDYRRHGRISYAEAADYAGVSVLTIRQWVSRKVNPLPLCARLGAYRIELLEPEKYLRRGL